MPALGIIGFERSGKTSLFNAVAGTVHAVGFATHAEPHIGVVKVPDPRLDRLSALYHPRRQTPVDLRYVDFPGAGFGGGAGPPVRFLDQLSQMDALIHVARAFESDAVPHPRRRVDAARDLENMTLELLFADLALIEKRLDRMRQVSKALRPAERTRVELEEALLRRLRTGLEENAPLRALPLSEDERRRIQHYRFLTDRPLVTILNLGEADLAEADAIAERLGAGAALCALLEMELAALTPEEADEYRRALGAREGALSQAVRLSYEALGLITFFTGGGDECRGWPLRRGATARDAAGTIHSDMEHGFIRAEVVNWEDLVHAGSEAEARKRALLRTEGKDYVVRDGDVLHILFNV